MCLCFCCGGVGGVGGVGGEWGRGLGTRVGSGGMVLCLCEV